MFCRNCGRELDDNDKFCGKCGTPRATTNVADTARANYNNTVNNANSRNDAIIYAVIGFVAPIIGIILSLFTKKDKPEAANIGLMVSFIRIILTVAGLIFRIVFAIVT